MVRGRTTPVPLEIGQPLRGWNLITPDGRGRWAVVGSTCLYRLAEAWGVLDTIRSLITRHRGERASYRRALRIPDVPYADNALADWTACRPPDPPPLSAPPDPFEAALAPLQRELGATLTPG